jgi:peptidylprolyl isomerase
MSKQLLRVAAGVCLLAAGCGSDDKKPKTTPSGLKYIDHSQGVGEPTKAGDWVEVNYTGTLRADGSKFGSSHDSNEPFVYQIGGREMTEGFDEGVTGLKPGGKRKLIVPARLGYGERGAGGNIPPNSDLVYEVELLRVIKRVTRLEIDDIKIGTGDEVKKGSRVEVIYTGRLVANRKQFDTNVGKAPFAVTVGVGQLIAGFDEGLLGMRVGGKRKLSIPARLAYGTTDHGLIPADADVEFEIEVLGTK